MTKMKQVIPESHTDHPYDNGAIGAIGAIGGTVGAIGSLIIAEEMEHPVIIPPKKIT